MAVQEVASADDISSVLHRWANEGSAQIPRNYEFFRKLLDTTIFYLQNSDHDTASVFASCAAFHASARHCGIWASPELERCLHQIGSQLSALEPGHFVYRRRTEVKHVCHVATAVYPVGGLTRMLARWVGEDKGRCHSLALTRQSTKEVPDFLVQSICTSGGHIHRIDGVIGGLLDRAKKLRSIVEHADLVVLHIHPDDVVPIIALATGNRPPVVYLDHADHSFWLGTTVSDVIANMRKPGRRLSIERRGVDPARVALLPTILEPRQREISREAAKRRLGLPVDCILLTSVARARKYRSTSRTNYADLHVRTLLEHSDSVLLVVGPGGQLDWSEAIQKTNGRVIVLPECEDPSIFFQAADIYVDSFPFVSITSVLEAGSYGTPAISLFPFSDDCAVLGCDMPGLDSHLVRCQTLDEYIGALSHLIRNPARRARLGEALARCIWDNHTGENWLKHLNIVYELALESLPSEQPGRRVDDMRIAEPDVYIQPIHGGDPNAERDLNRMLQFELGVLPTRVRVREWWRLLKAGFLRNTGRFGPAIHLIPEWARCRAGRFRRRLSGLQHRKGRSTQQSTTLVASAGSAELHRDTYF